MLHMLGYVTMFVPISWEIADVVLMLYSEIMAMHPFRRTKWRYGAMPIQKRMDIANSMDGNPPYSSLRI